MELPRAPWSQGAQGAAGLLCRVWHRRAGSRRSAQSARACGRGARGFSEGAGLEAPRTRPGRCCPLLCGDECHIWKLPSFLHGWGWTGAGAAPSLATSPGVPKPLPGPVGGQTPRVLHAPGYSLALSFLHPEVDGWWGTPGHDPGGPVIPPSSPPELEGGPARGAQG